MISVKIEGYNDFLRQIQKLPDKMKRTEINKLLRREAKPTLKLAKSKTPKEKRNRTIIRYNKAGEKVAEYKPGNLAKSIKTITVSRKVSKGNPRVVVGPKVGKRGKNINNDGYYAWFLIRGTKHIAPMKNWIHEAFNSVGAEEKTMEALRKYLVKRSKELGLDAK